MEVSAQKSLVQAFVLGILLSCAAINSLFAASRAESQRVEAAAASDRWQAILFYAPRLWGPDSSLVDAANFFLAPEGKVDPLAELKATLAAFEAEESLPPADALHRCRFPARYDFLKAAMGGLTHSVLDCPSVARAFANAAPGGASLIFSSFYLNNPASMMGHSFIRFHRAKAKGGLSNLLFDYVLNFAANPTTENDFALAVGGLLGWFPGTTMLLPYYLKIGEYVNYESRDLWDYQLDLTPAEVFAMFLSTLELSRSTIDYFYADENCSYIMLFFIDTARPSLRLRYRLRTVAAPLDTIKVLSEAGIVQEISYVPSQRTRFESTYAQLDPAQKRAFLRLVEGGEIRGDGGEALSAAQSTPIIDAALEYVIFAEKLIGNRQPERYAELYARLLRQRAQAGPSTELLAETPENQAPHLGHYSKRVSLGYAREQGNGSAQYPLVGLRLNFHDSASPGPGYPRGLGIELGSIFVSFPYDGSAEPRLEAFQLIAIHSLAAQSLTNPTPSWQLEMSYRREPYHAGEARRGVYSLRGGVGLTRALASDAVLLSLFLSPELAATPSGHGAVKSALSLGPELLIHPSNFVSVLGSWQWGSDFDAAPAWVSRRRVGLKLKLGQESELQFGHETYGASEKFEATFHQFF